MPIMLYVPDVEKTAGFDEETTDGVHVKVSVWLAPAAILLAL
jgi:hypothetical protein